MFNDFYYFQILFKEKRLYETIHNLSFYENYNYEIHDVRKTFVVKSFSYTLKKENTRVDSNYKKKQIKLQV